VTGVLAQFADPAPGLQFVCFVLSVYSVVLLARVILSWIPALPEGLRPVVSLIYSLTEPIMRFVRPLIPPLRIGMVALDLSILLVFFLMGLLQRAICS
jgi:YggT family protein